MLHQSCWLLALLVVSSAILLSHLATIVILLSDLAFHLQNFSYQNTTIVNARADHCSQQLLPQAQGARQLFLLKLEYAILIFTGQAQRCKQRRLVQHWGCGQH